MVQAVSVRDETTGEPSRVDLSGVFVYVGLEPNSGVIESLLTVDGGGHVPTDIWMRTELPGLLAAGDIRQGSSVAAGQRSRRRRHGRDRRLQVHPERRVEELSGNRLIHR